MKYSNYDIVFQEVPDEITLAINIANCPHHCDGCHSPFLSEDIGRYIDDDIDAIIKKYEGMITCVCFMGGDQCVDDLLSLIKKVHSYGLKAALYSGIDDASLFEGKIEIGVNGQEAFTKPSGSFCSEMHANNRLFEVAAILDYLKIGSYKKELGGLATKGTNQHMYKREFCQVPMYDKENGRRIPGKTTIKYCWKDITYRFQKELK